MKDYKLSEIKEICKQQSANYYGDEACIKCPIYNMCSLILQCDILPENWEIEIN